MLAREAVREPRRRTCSICRAKRCSRSRRCWRSPGRTRPELEQALALYERKGNLVMAERVRSML
jgi:hypothetical protein